MTTTMMAARRTRRQRTALAAGDEAADSLSRPCPRRREGGPAREPPIGPPRRRSRGPQRAPPGAARAGLCSRMSLYAAGAGGLAGGPGTAGARGAGDMLKGVSDALRGACSFQGLTLPEPLPPEPVALLAQWLADASAAGTQPNPNAMTLATIDPDGRPSARIVLCRGLDEARGFLTFYTNYDGRKGRALAAHPRAALVFHWDHLERQVRIEGPVAHAPAAESDAYFAGRPPGSRVAAWASDQSAPLASRDQLLARQRQAEARFGVPEGVDPDTLRGLNVPRPPHWGGVRVYFESVELWLGHPNRLHDRAVWTRPLTPATVDGVPGYGGGAWRVTRLMP